MKALLALALVAGGCTDLTDPQPIPEGAMSMTIPIVIEVPLVDGRFVVVSSHEAGVIQLGYRSNDTGRIIMLIQDIVDEDATKVAQAIIKVTQENSDE